MLIFTSKFLYKLIINCYNRTNTGLDPERVQSISENDYQSFSQELQSYTLWDYCASIIICYVEEKHKCVL